MNLPRHWRLCGATASLVITLTASGANEPAKAADADKPFHLFAGADVTANVDGQYRPVIGAGPQSLVVLVDRKSRDIPLGQAKDIRVTPRLKLANASAEITQLSGILSSDAARAAQFRAMESAMAASGEADAARDRAQGEILRAETSVAMLSHTYGPRNDPTQQPNGPSFTDRLINNIRSKAYTNYVNVDTVAARQQSFAQQKLTTTTAAEPNSGEGVELTPQITSEGVRLAAPTLAGQTARRTELADSTSSTMTTTARVSTRVVAPAALVDAGNGISDRLDVECRISSAQPLEKAYMILITDFTTAGRDGVREFRRVSGQRIGSIDGKLRKVTIYQTGFPPGFHVTQYRVVLFADGQEVATNLIDNQAALSEDEAYEYILKGYLASHKSHTSPPAAMLMWPKSKVGAADSPALRQPIYVSVDSTGKVTAVSADPAMPKDVSPAITDTLRYFRFIPALQAGNPVDGRAKVVLADFVR